MGRKSNKNRRKKQKLAKKEKRKYQHMTNQAIAVYKASLKRNLSEAVAGLLESFCDHHNHYTMIFQKNMLLTIVEDGYAEWEELLYNPGLRDNEFQMKQSIWMPFPGGMYRDPFQWEAFLGAFKEAEYVLKSIIVEVKEEGKPSVQINGRVFPMDIIFEEFVDFGYK